MRNWLCAEKICRRSCTVVNRRRNFQLFLLDKSSLESVIILTQRLMCNYTCTNAAALENGTKNMRIKRSMGSTSASSTKLTSQEKVFSIGLGKNKRNNKKKNKKRVIKISKKEDLKKLDKSVLRLQKMYFKK